MHRRTTGQRRTTPYPATVSGQGKSLKTRLILELKAHKTPEQETRAVEGIVKMIKDKGLEDRTEYITFSQHATKEFIRLAPKGTPVYYLTGDLTPKELKAWGCAGPDYHFSVFQNILNG